VVVDVAVDVAVAMAVDVGVVVDEIRGCLLTQQRENPYCHRRFVAPDVRRIDDGDGNDDVNGNENETPR